MHTNTTPQTTPNALVRPALYGTSRTQMINFSLCGLGESFVKCNVAIFDWSVWNRGEISPVIVSMS